MPKPRCIPARYLFAGSALACVEGEGVRAEAGDDDQQGPETESTLLHVWGRAVLNNSHGQALAPPCRGCNMSYALVAAWKSIRSLSTGSFRRGIAPHWPSAVHTSVPSGNAGRKKLQCWCKAYHRYISVPSLVSFQTAHAFAVFSAPFSVCMLTTMLRSPILVPHLPSLSPYSVW